MTTPDKNQKSFIRWALIRKDDGRVFNVAPFSLSKKDFIELMTRTHNWPDKMMTCKRVKIEVL